MNKIISISTLLEFSKIDIQNILFAIAITFSVVLLIKWALKEIRSMLDYYYEIRTKEIENARILEEISEKTKKQQESIDILTLAIKELLADRLSQKYRYYKELKYIPEDEYDQYCDMHTVYNKCGGNHTGDKKFEQSMELPVR